MKLRALRLHGFKSFADRTEVVFHDGITAIVGPNGCGKSNISDAIRWVLGEQRPSAIRGARMEEAIFQGTVSRRAVNRGAVVLELSNEDGTLPVPFEEVEISRTVFRDGGSDYALNRSSCRLRDIQDLCRDTGLGANAYSIIENRMIDAILSDRTDERRSLFEEAAGIGKYKDRRRSASRRLERAEMDLQRLEDLIGEVQSKVRSLARQKGRAERHRELRDRRRTLEVTLARGQIREWQERLEEIRRLLEGGLGSDESLQAEIRTAEARVETLRAQRLAAEKERSAAAASLDEVRTELARWERELAVASERGGQAERRLARIDGEREEAVRLREEAHREAGELELREAEVAGALEELGTRVEEARSRSAGVRERLGEARSELDRVEGREREVARRTAQLRGDAEAAASQAEELDRRAGHLEREVEVALESLRELDTQGDLFTDRAEALSRGVEAARTTLEADRERIMGLRTRLEAAREEEMAAMEGASSLRARREALERLESDREGMDPVLKALLDAGVEGVVGILADFITAEGEVARALESYLGAHTRGLVVRDQDAAHRVHRWFREEWTKGGGLILLPLDAVPADLPPSGSLLDRVQVEGEGSPWVRVLLGGVEMVEETAVLSARVPGGAGGDRVASDGSIVDRRGVMRLGNPLGTTGLLERREELKRLEREVGKALKTAAGARSEREAAQEALVQAESELETSRTRLREAEDLHREARAEETARGERRGRLERERKELEEQLEGTRTAARRARQRAIEAGEAREALLEEEEGLREAREVARRRAEEVQAAWESARAEETTLTVEHTRREGELHRVRDRRLELTRAVETAERRLTLLEDEEKRSREEVEAVGRLRREGEEALQALFARRTEAQESLRSRDQALAGLDEALAEAERRVREAHSSEREVSNRRHRLELEAGELSGRMGRVEERLEGEWARPLAELMAEAPELEGEPEALQEELREVTLQLERLGPVNMLAVEEHEEESARLRFLTEQRDDLVEARNDLGSAIREINQTATRLFEETFEAVRENFRTTFVRLFQGGEADLSLEDPDDPLESQIEIHASPRGKRTQRIDLLSGGERALTALSLLFGLYLAKPSPFCVLDEVDAPLDESNIGRFIRLLEEFKEETQFVVITHNPRTIEAADWIYGVTMEEPGVSSIVGVRLEEALEAAGAEVAVGG